MLTTAYNLNKDNVNSDISSVNTGIAIGPVLNGISITAKALEQLQGTKDAPCENGSENKVNHPHNCSNIAPITLDHIDVQPENFMSSETSLNSAPSDFACISHFPSYADLSTNNTISGDSRDNNYNTSKNSNSSCKLSH